MKRFLCLCLWRWGTKSVISVKQMLRQSAIFHSPEMSCSREVDCERAVIICWAVWPVAEQLFKIRRRHFWSNHFDRMPPKSIGKQPENTNARHTDLSVDCDISYWPDPFSNLPTALLAFLVLRLIPKPKEPFLSFSVWASRTASFAERNFRITDLTVFHFALKRVKSKSLIVVLSCIEWSFTWGLIAREHSGLLLLMPLLWEEIQIPHSISVSLVCVCVQNSLMLILV